MEAEVAARVCAPRARLQLRAQLRGLGLRGARPRLQRRALRGGLRVAHEVQHARGRRGRRVRRGRRGRRARARLRLRERARPSHQSTGRRGRACTACPLLSLPCLALPRGAPGAASREQLTGQLPGEAHSPRTSSAARASSAPRCTAKQSAKHATSGPATGHRDSVRSPARQRPPAPTHAADSQHRRSPGRVHRRSGPPQP